MILFIGTDRQVLIDFFASNYFSKAHLWLLALYLLLLFLTIVTVLVHLDIVLPT